jgi:hypothetical protein
MLVMPSDTLAMCVLSDDRNVALRMKVAFGFSKGYVWIRSASCGAWLKPDPAYRVLFLPQDLTRRLEVDTEHALIALVCQADVLDRRDMEWSNETVNGQDDGRLHFVDVDLRNVNPY